MASLPLRRQRPGTVWGDRQTSSHSLAFLVSGTKRYLKRARSLSERECAEMPFECQEKEGSAVEVITVKCFPKIVTGYEIAGLQSKLSSNAGMPTAAGSMHPLRRQRRRWGQRGCRHACACGRAYGRGWSPDIDAAGTAAAVEPAGLRVGNCLDDREDCACARPRGPGAGVSQHCG